MKERIVKMTSLEEEKKVRLNEQILAGREARVRANRNMNN
jgi:hypothetical protein